MSDWQVMGQVVGATAVYGTALVIYATFKLAHQRHKRRERHANATIRQR
jgi:hypothetical protein